MKSLVVRISFFTAGAILIAGIALTALSVRLTANALVAVETEHFQRRTLWLADELEYTIEQAMRDAQVVATSPHLTSATDWITRPVLNGAPPQPPAYLEDYFLTVAQSDPDFYQLRLIDRDGWERVRVNRGDAGAYAVPTEFLQQKRDRPYFKTIERLPLGGVFVSEVNQNVERGVIQRPFVPVIRIGIPLHDVEGRFMAVVLINIDLRPLIEHGSPLHNPNSSIALLSQDGVPLWSLRGDGSYGNDTHLASLRDGASGSLGEHQQANRSHVVQIEGVQTLAITAWIAAETLGNATRMGILRTVPYADVTQAARKSTRASLLLLLPGLFLYGPLVAYLAHLYLRPRRRMAAIIRERGAALAPDDLPELTDTEGRILRTALYDALTALRAKEERLLLAIEGSSDGLWDWFEVGKEAAWWSPAYYRLLGYEDGEIEASLGTFRKLIHPDDAAPMAEAVRLQVEEGVPFDVEYRLKTKSGVYRWYRARARVSTSGDARAPRLAGSLQDIHERKLAEAARDRYEQRLKQSLEELNRFAYIASHDLKAPLRAIDNLAQWVHKDCHDLLPERQRDYLTKMRGRVERMEKLLEDLLQYSRAGRKRGEREEISISTYLREVCDFLAIPDRFAVTIVEPMPTASLYVTPFRHVVQNLIGNAVKHHDKDHGKIVITCTVEGGMLQLTVSDDGPGIPEAMRDRAFELFQTLQSRDKVEGSGMGLAIVKKLVEAEGGSIAIIPKDTPGTTFWLQWPMEET